MDCVNRRYSTLTQTGEGADDNLSAGRKGNSPIQFHGWSVIFLADPGRAQGDGPFAMGGASGRNIDLAIPGLQNGNREAGGAAKAK